MDKFKAFLAAVGVAALSVVGYGTYQNRAEIKQLHTDTYNQSENFKQAFHTVIVEQARLQKEIDSLAPTTIINNPVVNPKDHDRLDVRIGQLEHQIHGKNGILARLGKK